MAAVSLPLWFVKSTLVIYPFPSIGASILPASESLVVVGVLFWRWRGPGRERCRLPESLDLQGLSLCHHSESHGNESP